MNKNIYLILIVLFILIMICSCNTNQINNSNIVENYDINNLEIEIINNVSSDYTRILNGYIIYQHNFPNNNYKYLYDPLTEAKYQVPKELHNENGSSIFLNISDNTATTIGFQYPSNIIVSKWNIKTNSLTQHEFNLNFNEVVDTQYLNKNIFIAFDNCSIVRIDEYMNMNIYNFSTGFNFITYPSVLVVHNNQLYVNNDRDIVYRFDKSKNDFLLLSPSPTFAIEEGLYYVEDNNKIKVENGTHSTSFLMPQIPEDLSLHKENSYYVIDSYKDTHVISMYSLPNGYLYVYSKDKLTKIPIINDASPKATLKNENELIYTDNGKLYLYNIATTSKSLILNDVQPLYIEKINEYNYYALVGEKINIVKIK